MFAFILPSSVNVNDRCRRSAREDREHGSLAENELDAGIPKIGTAIAVSQDTEQLGN